MFLTEISFTCSDRSVQIDFTVPSPLLAANDMGTYKITCRYMLQVKRRESLWGLVMAACIRFCREV